MNGEPQSKILTFNQLVRSIITLALTAGVLYGFAVMKVVSAEVFVPLATLAITWWLNRDQQSASSKESADLLKTPAPSNPPPQQENP